jgi:hypothetical protein
MGMKILIAAMIIGIADIWMSFGIGHLTGVGRHPVTDTTIVPSINQPVPNINSNGKPPATTDTGKGIHTIHIDSSRLIRN